MTKLRNVLFALPLAVLACASDDANGGTPAGLSGNGSGNNSGGGSNPGKTPGPATSEQVGQCKNACDQQKTFLCYDAAQHASCLQDCAGANTDQADQFIRCVGTAACDAECSTQLTQPPANNGGTGGTSSSGGLCDQACDKGIACKQVTEGARAKCVEECGDASVPNSVKQCVIDTPCAQIPDTCGGSFGSQPVPGGSSGAGGGSSDIPTTDQLACESSCTSITLADCLPSGTLAKCKARCKLSSKQRREAFNDCVFASGGQCFDDRACYDAFQVD